MAEKEIPDLDKQVLGDMNSLVETMTKAMTEADKLQKGLDRLSDQSHGYEVLDRLIPAMTALEQIKDHWQDAIEKIERIVGSIDGVKAKFANIQDKFETDKMKSGVDNIKKLIEKFKGELEKLESGDTWIKDIRETIIDFMNVDLTDQQIIDYVEEHDPACKKEFDTLSRESMMDFIGHKVTGIYMPTNGDTEEYKAKYKALWNENIDASEYKEIEVEA